MSLADCRAPKGVLHKFIFERYDRASVFEGPHKVNLSAPHRPRQMQPGSQTEKRTPPRGMGRDHVVLADNYQCQHWPCTRMVKLPHGVRVGDDGGGWCPHCNGLICAACMKLSKCIPMEEGLYRFEQLAKLKERMGAQDLLRDIDSLNKLKEIGLISGEPST